MMEIVANSNDSRDYVVESTQVVPTRLLCVSIALYVHYLLRCSGTNYVSYAYWSILGALPRDSRLWHVVQRWPRGPYFTFTSTIAHMLSHAALHVV